MTKKHADSIDMQNPPQDVPHVDRAMLDRHLARAAVDPQGELETLVADEALSVGLWPLRTALEREAGNRWRAPYEVEVVACHVVARLAKLREANRLPAVEIPDQTLTLWKQLHAPPACLPVGEFVLERIAERASRRRTEHASEKPA